MKKLLERIRSVIVKDKGYPNNVAEYLNEECGEVNTALAVEKGLKNRKLEETTEQECVDVIVVALAIILRNKEWGLKEIKEYMDVKIKKWEKSVEN